MAAENISSPSTAPADWSGILISGLFAFAAVLLSIWLIFKHLSNFTKPTYQRHIVRILLMVPVYSFSAWFTYIFPQYALSFDLLRSCYEAFVIYEFFNLLLAYLGDSEQERRHVFSLKEPQALLFPFCCLIYDPKSWYFLMDMKVCVLQYTIVRPLTTIIALMLEANGALHSESFNPKYGNFWFTIINFMSVSVAMYSLILFFLTIAKDISDYRPLNKFLSVKFVVFMTFWQSLIIGAMAYFQLIPDSTYWSADHIALRVQSFLLCLEMFLASLWHCRDTCFGYSEYVSTSSTNIKSAMWDCFNPMETVKDTFQSIQHLTLRSRQIARPNHEPVVQQDIEMESQMDLGNGEDNESLTAAFRVAMTDVVTVVEDVQVYKKEDFQQGQESDEFNRYVDTGSVDELKQSQKNDVNNRYSFNQRS